MNAGSKKVIRLVGSILFFLYILLLIYFLFFAEWYGRTSEVHLEPQYNLIPMLEIKRFWIYREQIGIWNVFLNLGGNVFGFVPYGFILPILHPYLNRGWFVIFSGMLMSIIVETMQLIGGVGSCDIDDVILNTTGAFLGYICFIICNRIRRRYYGKSKKI